MSENIFLNSLIDRLSQYSDRIRFTEIFCNNIWHLYSNDEISEFQFTRDNRVFITSSGKSTIQGNYEILSHNRIFINCSSQFLSQNLEFYCSIRQSILIFKTVPLSNNYIILYNPLNFMGLNLIEYLEQIWQEEIHYDQDLNGSFQRPISQNENLGINIANFLLEYKYGILTIIITIILLIYFQ